jgi:succinate dehydrogenase flavin-adding protein (antitoxin of CptAB toxin-antitoxin module)
MILKGFKMLETDKTIKEILKNKIKEYKENNNKKALSIILNLIKKDIAKLIIENEFPIKLTKEIIENLLNIEIKDDTFYKWVRRNIKEKSNIKEKKNSAPKKINKKESKNEVKNKKINPIKILNSDISLIKEDYKNLL